MKGSFLLALVHRLWVVKCLLCNHRLCGKTNRKEPRIAKKWECPCFSEKAEIRKTANILQMRLAESEKKSMINALNEESEMGD